MPNTWELLSPRSVSSVLVRNLFKESLQALPVSPASTCNVIRDLGRPCSRPEPTAMVLSASSSHPHAEAATVEWKTQGQLDGAEVGQSQGEPTRGEPAKQHLWGPACTSPANTFTLGDPKDQASLYRGSGALPG